MFKVVTAYSVRPVRSMAKVAEGFNWKIVSHGAGGQEHDVVFFEHRSEAEQVCLEINAVDEQVIETFAGAA